MFNGEILAGAPPGLEIHRRLKGETYEALVAGIKCVAKYQKMSVRQVVLDEFKPSFGLQKVGMTYYGGIPILIMKFHESFGTASDVAKRGWFKPEAIADFFVRCCVYDFAVNNGDRQGTNILVLAPHLFLAIDEAARPSLRPWQAQWGKVGARLHAALRSEYEHWPGAFSSRLAMTATEAENSIDRVFDRYLQYIGIDGEAGIRDRLSRVKRGDLDWIQSALAPIVEKHGPLTLS